MGEEHVERWHAAGRRVQAALLKKWAAEEEYQLALAELDVSSRELHLDAARWARELQERVVAERQIVEAGGSPQVRLVCAEATEEGQMGTSEEMLREAERAEAQGDTTRAATLREAAEEAKAQEAAEQREQPVRVTGV